MPEKRTRILWNDSKDETELWGRKELLQELHEGENPVRDNPSVQAERQLSLFESKQDPKSVNMCE